MGYKTAFEGILIGNKAVRTFLKLQHILTFFEKQQL